MALNDLDVLLGPVSAEAPCGTDLTGSAEFQELERIAKGKPEQQIGNTIVPAEEPDWKALQAKSIELLKKSKHLWIAVQLVRSLARTDGWLGLAKGLSIVRGLVERYWDGGLYPPLDVSDNNDPMERVNKLRDLVDPPFLASLRKMPLVVSKTLGKFSLKEIEIAAGEAQPDKGVPPTTAATLDGAVRDSDLEAFEQSTLAVKTGLDMAKGLQAALAAKIDAADAISTVADLAAMLAKVDAYLTPRLAQRKPLPVEEVAATAADATGKPAATAPAAARAAGVSGPFSSREEVIKAIELIVAYYARYEPSNPVPLLMARCKRLVMMSFVDIVKELVPEALKQVEALKGHGD